MNAKKQLTEEEIIEIIERELPRIIETKPEVRYKIEEILEKKCATKEDIKILLQEIEKNRIETNKRFEAIDKRFEDINKRFEAIDKRFEDINKRFEAIDKRFEAIDKRFEAIDKRFETLEKMVFEGFRSMQRTISAIGTRWGYGAEEAFRKGFEEVLSEIGYTVMKWRKMDEKGEFFLRKRPAEIDIVIRNQEKIALEVKSSLNFSEVDDFEKSVNFYEREEKTKITKKIIVAIYPRKGVEEYTRQFNIIVIKGLTEAEEYFENLS